ncbi:MAG: glycosyltransferase family A protein [Planctomycetaceae bacterium]
MLQTFPEEERILRRCVPLPDSQGQFGAALRDAGLREATGRYVVFWDDDNWFYPHAACNVCWFRVSETHLCGRLLAGF